MKYGEAQEMCVSGAPIARRGWKGKGMFVYHVPAAVYPAMTDAAKKYIGLEVQYNAYLAIRAVGGSVSPWVPSINDCLADDWEIAMQDWSRSYED